MHDESKDPLMFSMLHLLHRAGQAADELFVQAMNDSDLTPRQYAVLVALRAHDGTSQTDIVAATGIDRSTLADIVRRLVARGLVARRRSKQDARAYAVRLTASGLAALQAAAPAAAKAEERLVKVLSTAKRRELVDALSQVVRSLSASEH